MKRPCGIALGSNLGDRRDNIRRAVELLERALVGSADIPAAVRVPGSAPDGDKNVRRSMASLYETAPVDCDNDVPSFWNTVVEFETELCPENLLALTQSIEGKLGRPAEHGFNDPRLIDLDILYLGDVVFHSDKLQIPHPRLTERRFVLQPLSEIRPEMVLPGQEKSVAELLDTLESSEPPLTLMGTNIDEKLRKRADTGRAITALTAYDYPTARLLDEAGIDLILVGDSLGMVMLGHEDTTGVTMEMMEHHTAACRRGVKQAVLVADLPYRSYETPRQALANAKRLMAIGADAVKLEGGTEMLPQIDAIIGEGIPLIGHIGMLPQHVREEGGYKKKGKTQEQVKQLIRDAQDLECSGVKAIVLESMVASVAVEITGTISIPTIGIGASKSCDGQILVIHDLLGSFPWFRPSFARARADVAGETTRAVQEYIADVIENG